MVKGCCGRRRRTGQWVQWRSPAPALGLPSQRRPRRRAEIMKGWCKRGGRRTRQWVQWRSPARSLLSQRHPRQRAEMVKGWYGRGGRRTAGDGGLGNAFRPDLGGDDGKRRWWKPGAGEVVLIGGRRMTGDGGLGNGFHPDLGGDDNEAEMVKGWCRRGGRMIGDRRLENGFYPNLGGNDGKQRWWKAGAGEVVRERREENDRRWGARE